ncbi:hypothetical protein [Nocardia sp. NPDC057668]|uniref:hypothetical protein n=1 Tax=Nocardia sp. NPDC057668 TaxID=3346202 RepID=UPI003671C701
MAQPEFRRRITLRMREFPQPVPLLWSLVDRLHYGADAALTLAQAVHLGVHDRVVMPVFLRFGLSEGRAENYLVRHARIAGRAYDAARVAHWYL